MSAIFLLLLKVCGLAGFLYLGYKRLPRRQFFEMLIIWGLLIAGFGLLGLFGRARIEVQGEILNVESNCGEPEVNRCTTTYTIQSDSGRSHEYRAVGTDQALALDLLKGSRIDKLPWELNYTVDGNRVYDFPSLSYIFLSVAGLGMIGVGGQRLVRIKRLRRVASG